MTITAPILKTKLFVPPLRPDRVRRHRLIQQLDQFQSGSRLTLVSAPAGFGKTTLVSDWLKGGGARPSAWISLDKDDNDLGRFLTYFIAGLQQIVPNLGQGILARLQAPQLPDLESLLTPLINEITALDRLLLVVLDDYHLIESQEVHDLLTFLLAHQPPQLHLVITTRSDPPFPLSRLRGRGQLNELRMADLRFTIEETGSFLQEAMGLELSGEQVSVLEARTEGWIVGLQMVALSLRAKQPQEVRDFIAAFARSHRYVIDYLTEEVLLQQAKSVQTFLLQTAILDRMTASLCNVVTGRDDSQDMLERLEQVNLFIIPLDDERRWYRYHHLFVELLRKRSNRMNLERFPALHLAASDWFARHGLIAEAASHAVAAGDLERVARLVAGNALAMLEYPELATLERWLDELSHELEHLHPWISVAHAWIAALSGRLEVVQPLLRAIEKELESLPPSWGKTTLPQQEREHVVGHIAAIWSYMAEISGRPLEAAEQARRALEKLPSDDLRTRGWALMALALNLHTIGDFQAADQALAQAVETLCTEGESHVAVTALCNLGIIQMQKGQYLKANSTFQEALMRARDYSERAGRPLPVSGYVHCYLAIVLSEWDDLEGALWHGKKGVALCEQWGEPHLLATAYVCLSTVLQAVGDMEGALRALNQSRQAARTLSDHYTTRLIPTEIAYQLEKGELEIASELAAQWENASKERQSTWLRWFGELQTARVKVALEQYDQARDQLDELLKAAEITGRASMAIAAQAVQAAALERQGKLDQALQVLETVLVRAEPERIVRTFVDEGPPMARLLREATRRGKSSAFVDRLLEALAEQKGERTPLVIGSPPLLIEPLSEREQEVLRLMAAGLSNREIADTLFISINTVKSHLKSIFGKLDVRNRTQAVHRARELGLT